LAPLTELVTSLDVCSKAAPEALPVIVEENVKVQVANVLKTDTIARAWEAGKPVHVHGWVYLVEEGRLKDLQISQGPGSN
jgi:carbonic anhydrase